MIKRIAWSDEAARGLSRALREPILSIVADEVRRGQSSLYHCVDGSEEAYCVTRIDDNPKEFVVVAFEGVGMVKFGRKFVAAAKAIGAPMRVHTMSPVVARLLRRLGFEFNPRHVEMIVRKAA